MLCERLLVHPLTENAFMRMHLCLEREVAIFELSLKLFEQRVLDEGRTCVEQALSGGVAVVLSLAVLLPVGSSVRSNWLFGPTGEVAGATNSAIAPEFHDTKDTIPSVRLHH
jgi:hypothetical protein